MVKLLRMSKLTYVTLALGAPVQYLVLFYALLKSISLKLWRPGLLLAGNLALADENLWPSAGFCETFQHMLIALL